MAGARVCALAGGNFIRAGVYDFPQSAARGGGGGVGVELSQEGRAVMADPKPRAMVPRAVTPRVPTARAVTPRAVPPRFTRNRGPRRFGQKGPRRPERPTLSRLVAGLMLCVLMGLPGLAAIKLSQHVPGYGCWGTLSRCHCWRLFSVSRISGRQRTASGGLRKTSSFL